MQSVIIIPSRLSSTRLSEKPLADIEGKPLIQRVYENALSSKKAVTVAVATDSRKIAETVESFGGACHMTPADIASGSDRVYSVSKDFYPGCGIVVNLQGDEPFIDAGLVDSLIDLAERDDSDVFSAYYPIDADEAADSSVVKVAVTGDGRALYFSRSLIPCGGVMVKKHIGIYVWKKAALERFHDHGVTELEKTERLEQLRILEYGDSIRMLESPADSLGIDTPADLEKAREWVRVNC
ncbi:MAG: 3-deoxy-manno-octulosonate cytidylyltransferase [Elusimicrobia bacterium]|nr:3-deoxy-manno-octulosonate cytidylyltransferase [Elusimicrobiota bacterium]